MVEVMKRYAYPRQTLLFILIAVPLMIFVDLVLFGGKIPFTGRTLFQETPKQEGEAKTSANDIEAFRSAVKALEKPKIMYHAELELDGDFLPHPEPVINKPPERRREKEKKPAPVWKKEVWKKNAQTVKRTGAEAKVVIIIDDMGMGSSTPKVIPLPGPLTLSYLPYADSLPGQTRLAKAAGHELMIHVPMEPMKGTLDPGPDVLTSGMEKQDLQAALNKALKSFEGYVGINNHMGSKLTQDPEAMKLVMAVLEKHGLLFVDSKTIHSSLAGQTAASFNLPYAERDVFLDHNPDLDSVRSSLRKLEIIARTQGSAIAIGHPRPDTLQALKEWLPTLKEKGLTLVPVSAVVRRPSAVSSAREQLDPQPSRRLE